MRAIPLALLASLLFSRFASAQDTAAEPPKFLLLTSQRLRRLERDRTRQTIRWVNFENRVNTVPDSPERGFELALYYAVTQDEKRGREAVDWALAHNCVSRQVALILDWCGSLFSPEQKAQLTPGCASQQISGRQPSASLSASEQLFADAARGLNTSRPAAEWKQMLKDLEDGEFMNARNLYETTEYLTAIRALQHDDLRQDDPKFFSTLPIEFLLSLKPEQVQHPDWMTHIAALALVALDPNLESSQFLQGWALEDSQMLREGPGVAYEFLWADPYLPGVGYENLDPWSYDANGRLFARASWNADSCWIAVSSNGVQQENCPPGWRNSPAHFGHLTLTPMTDPCIDVAHRANHSDAVILWQLQPHQRLFYLSDKRKESVEADAAGMWRFPENVDGHVCTSLDKLKRP